MNKQDLCVLKTQKALMQAFTDLLKTKEFDRITVQDLCDVAFIQRSTFYRHYNDKYHLLASATKTALEHIKQAQISEQHAQNHRLRLEQYIDNLLTFVCENKAIIQHVISHNLHDEVTTIIYKQVYQTVYQQTLADMRAGKQLDINLNIYSHFLAGGLISIIINWTYASDNLQSVESVKSNIVALMDSARKAHLK